jgi:hypothetical protein
MRGRPEELDSGSTSGLAACTGRGRLPTAEASPIRAFGLGRFTWRLALVSRLIFLAGYGLMQSNRPLHCPWNEQMGESRMGIKSSFVFSFFSCLERPKAPRMSTNGRQT